MRSLFIGIILFLIWSALSTWFYIKDVIPVGDRVEETVTTPLADTLSENQSVDLIIPEIPESTTLYFDYNKSKFNSSDRLSTFIEESLNYFQYDSSSCMIIKGFTCSLGSEEFNRKLGMERAENVKNYLLKEGFSDHCLKAISKGEEDPVNDNSTEALRKMNRRVELEINKSK